MRISIRKFVRMLYFSKITVDNFTCLFNCTPVAVGGPLGL